MNAGQVGERGAKKESSRLATLPPEQRRPAFGRKSDAAGRAPFRSRVVPREEAATDRAFLLAPPPDPPLLALVLLVVDLSSAGSLRGVSQPAHSPRHRSAQREDRRGPRRFSSLGMSRAAGPTGRGFTVSHQKVALELTFSGASVLGGYTELTVIPADKHLRTVHLNSRQCGESCQIRRPVRTDTSSVVLC